MPVFWSTSRLSAVISTGAVGSAFTAPSVRLVCAMAPVPIAGAATASVMKRATARILKKCTFLIPLPWLVYQPNAVVEKHPLPGLRIGGVDQQLPGGQCAEGRADLEGALRYDPARG